MNNLLNLDVWKPALAAFVVAAAFTPVVRAAARRLGMEAAPKQDRWHNRPTALLGGIAIYAAVLAVAAWYLFQTGSGSAFTRAILPAGTLLFAIGLIDDIVTLKPYQ